MAPSTTPPPGTTAINSTGLVVTNYSTELDPACLPKGNAPAKEGKKKGVESCSEKFSYYIQYPARRTEPLNGTLTIGSDGKTTIKAGSQAPQQKNQQQELANVLTPTAKSEIAKQFGDIASYVAAWKKPISEPKTDKGGKPTGVINQVLLDPASMERPINFIVLGAASGFRSREIALELMGFDKDAILKVLENLKEQAAKTNDPVHQDQKGRIESLIEQLNVASAASQIVTKDVPKNYHGDLILLTRSFVVTTLTNSSPDTRAPLDVLKSKFDDFARANAKGVTLTLAGPPPQETSIDPYQFLLTRLLELKAESAAYRNNQTAPGKMIEESIDFLGKAAKDKKIYLFLSPEEAFSRSLIAGLTAEQLAGSVLSELSSPQTYTTRANFEAWLKGKTISPQEENYKKVAADAVLEGVKFDAKEGIVITPNKMNEALKFLSMADKSGKLTLEQKNSYLAAIATVRALLGNESSLKKSIKAWDPIAKDFKDIPIKPGFEPALTAVMGEWQKALGAPLVATAPNPNGQVLQGKTEPPATNKPPLVGPPAPTQEPQVPLVPEPQTPQPNRTATITHWSLFATELALVIAGSAMLASGLQSTGDTSNPEQGGLNLGNTGLIHSGGGLVGAGLGGLLGRGTSVLIGRLQPNKPWVPVRSIVPDLIGAGLGLVLGATIPLIRADAVEIQTGGGNVQRNPAMEYGTSLPIRNGFSVRLFSGRF